MNGRLEIRSVTKSFGTQTVVRDVSIDVAAGEFLGILGPSGCGKTTLLRMVAGLESTTSGEIALDERDITRLPAHRRPINTVFQRYLLFPHLDVGDNIAFGLRVARMSRTEVDRRVHDALRLVRLSGYERRRSTEISGGQAQRISLARALVNEPKVLLLDEPLSALDLKVRQEMQGELRRIHRETGTTFLYVTHDQQEALSMADRVVVMKDGMVEQVGTPADVYHNPASVFVAGFVGDANILPVDVESSSSDSTLVDVRGCGRTVNVKRPFDHRSGWLVLRPEALTVSTSSGDLPGVVVDIAFLGSTVVYAIEIGSGVTLRAAEAGTEMRPRFGIGERVHVSHDPEACLLLADHQLQPNDELVSTRPSR